MPSDVARRRLYGFACWLNFSPSPPTKLGERAGERWHISNRLRSRLNYFSDLRRSKTMILHLPHQRYTTSSPMQRVPDFQKNSFAACPPLMVPKPQFLDAL